VRGLIAVEAAADPPCDPVGAMSAAMLGGALVVARSHLQRSAHHVEAIVVLPASASSVIVMAVERGPERAAVARLPFQRGLWRKLGDDGLRRVAYRGG
jgi:hypothetical protein